MKPFWWMNPVRDEDPEAGGGGDGKLPEAKPGDGEAKPPESETPPTKAELKAARDEAATAKARAKELEDSNAYWYEKANAKPDGKGKKADKDDDAEDEVDIVEQLNTQGTKGLRQFLKKEGYISKQEAEALVDTRARALVEESKLIEEFPDLQNKESELFKETSRQYKMLGDDVKPEKRTQLAAKLAKAEMIGKGTWKDPKEAADTEAKRLERIAAQNGGHPGSNGGGGSPGDGKLSKRQAMFAAEIIGGDKAEESYRKRATEGVQFARRVDLGTQLGAE